jgi:hypothetical protein
MAMKNQTTVTPTVKMNERENDCVELQDGWMSDFDAGLAEGVCWQVNPKTGDERLMVRRDVAILYLSAKAIELAVPEKDGAVIYFKPHEAAVAFFEQPEWLRAFLNAKLEIWRDFADSNSPEAEIYGLLVSRERIQEIHNGLRPGITAFEAALARTDAELRANLVGGIKEWIPGYFAEGQVRKPDGHGRRALHAEGHRKR